MEGGSERERERDLFLMFSLDLDIGLFGRLPHSVGCGRQLSSCFTSKCGENLINFFFDLLFNIFIV
jgi:hypothetical protein